MKKVITAMAATCALAACGGPRDINNDMVFYAFDSAEITNDARDSLRDQALYLKNNPDTRVVMEGHCDERGTIEYNLALGAVRAGNAAHVLISEGIEPERIRTISYGKENPQFPGTGEAVWAKNRNATTKLVD